MDFQSIALPTELWYLSKNAVQIYGKISFLKMPSQKISTINNHAYGLPTLLPKSSKSYKEKKMPVKYEHFGKRTLNDRF
jgi:hypothetical protein